MARAVEHRERAASNSVGSEHSTRASSVLRGAGPKQIGDFLPRLQTHMRWIPVRIWRDGTWQVVWVVIRSLELVHVASKRPLPARRFDWRDHA